MKSTMLKRLLSFVMVLAMVMSYVVMPVAAEEGESEHTHNYVAGEPVAATCTADGYTTYACDCGDSYTGDAVTATGHSYESGVCTACGGADPSYVAPVNEEPAGCEHSWNEGVTTGATCTASGSTVYTCTVEGCGETKTDTIDPLGHSFADGVCTVCGETDPDYVAPCNHIWGEGVTVEATCTESGSTVYTCTIEGCGETKTDTIDPLGHSFADGVCTVCGESDPDYVAPCNHIWGEGVTVEATCTESGSTVYTCTVEGCGETKTDTIDVKGHTYENGVCTVCGAAESVCNCTVRCAETVNMDCPVCSTEGGICTYEEEEPAPEMPKALYFSDQDKTWGSEVKVVYVDAEGNATEATLSYADRGYFYSGEVPAGTVSFYFTDGESQTQSQTIEAVLTDGYDMCVIFDGSVEWMEYATWEQMNTVDDPVAKVGEVPCTSLADAVQAANAIEGGATVKLLQDVTLGEKLTITGNVTIEGAYTITRDDAYTGTLFTVNAGATLTLDGGLTIDGGNEWTMDMAGYKADLDAYNEVTDGTKYFTPEEGAPVATAYMIVTNDTVNLNKVTIKNHYSKGSGIVEAKQDAIVNLTGATITHNANVTGSGLVVNAYGKNTWDATPAVWVTMNEGTVIDGNHVGGNHGVFKIYSGTVFTMNGGSIKNTTGWNSNGVAIGIYWATVVMNGGEICSNSSVNGTANGRNAAVYVHNSSSFTMEGGTICHNTGAYGGLDMRTTDTNSATISGGSIINNTSVIGSEYCDVKGNDQLTITGGTFSQDVNQWCADGYEAVDQGDGTWDVDQLPVAQVGEAKYYSIQEAINSVQSGESATVTILQDHTVDTNGDYALIRTNGKNITLDLNEKTVTFDYTQKTNDKTVYTSIYVNGGSELTVTGNGTLYNKGDNYTARIAWVATNSTMTVENGTYINEQKNTMFYTSCTLSGATRNTELYVKGGTFIQNATEQGDNDCFNMQDNSSSKQLIELSGGTYNEDPKAGRQNDWEVKIADDYKVVENGDGTWTVVMKDAVAQIGDKTYTSVQKAIDAAQSGETVTLLADVTVTESINVAEDDKITLDLNGKKLTNEIADGASSFHTIVNKGDLTVIDSVGGGEIQSNAAKGYVVYTEGGSLVVEGAKIVGINNGYALVTWTDGDTMTIEEGTVVEGRGALYIDGGATGTVNGGTFTMTVQTTNNQDNVVYVGGASELTINSGTFSTGDITGAQRIAVAALGTSKVTINGGEFYGLTGDIQAKDSTTVSVTDGTFNGTKMDERTTDAIALTGGTYSYNPTDWCAEGHCAGVNDEGTVWTVIEHGTETYMQGYRAPTCKVKGETGVEACANCDLVLENSTESQEIPTVPHEYEGDYICENEPYADYGHYQLCKYDCGNRSVTEPHEYQRTVTRAIVTATYTCTKCDYKKQAEEHEHELGDYKHDDDYHWKECESDDPCNEPEGEKIGKEKHEFGKWVTTKNPTKKQMGEKVRTCKDCGYKETKAIPKTIVQYITYWSDNPKTGDYIMIAVAVMVIAAGALAAIVIVNGKKKKK